ncbi:MAG: hypothetical protein OQJ83_04185 [Altibacter sp.]|uniref:hypothetical protein n=1 Tax=Altibacter lentus TaxID=1223410 RepID=UPI00069250C3|nr:hypothetical protein [Altibacter lentus]MCW8980564.1 hypothetical protein [Altibacter sp.]
MKSLLRSMLACTAVVALIIFCVSCDPQVEPPQQTISYEEANALEEDFIETRYNVINAALGYEDTREFWFSLDTLKKYIEYVEQEAGNQGLENLGMRIYFGAYPQNSNYPDAGYSTVFLVPTTQQASSDLRKGFLPVQPSNNNIGGIPPLNYSQGGQPPTNY